MDSAPTFESGVLSSKLTNIFVMSTREMTTTKKGRKKRDREQNR
jgi:hypothetical protein